MQQIEVKVGDSIQRIFLKALTTSHRTGEEVRFKFNGVVIRVDWEISTDYHKMWALFEYYLYLNSPHDSLEAKMPPDFTISDQLIERAEKNRKVHMEKCNVPYKPLK